MKLKMTLLAIFAIIYGTVFSADINPWIKIDLKNGKKVSRMTYGWHYEEIGMMGDGGLYAEMIRNRGFEEANPPEGLTIENGLYKDVVNPKGQNKKVYEVDPLIGWTTTPLSCSPINIELTSQNPLNINNPHSMLVKVTGDISPNSDASILNRGFFGMGFKKGTACRLSFYAMTKEYDGDLCFVLVDEKGNRCSQPVIINPDGNDWKQYKAKLVPDRTVAHGMLSIVPTKKGSFQLDMVSMFPSDTWDNGKSVFRSDIMENLKAYKPDFIRFPGGCIVHGVNEQTMYHWKKTIGDIANRPGEWSKWEPNFRSDGLGYHEFYELCEYLGADAMYVTPTGMVCTEWVDHDKNGTLIQKPTNVNYYIQDALDAIEYAIGPITSKWGAERAKNGHPKPFPLKYVEIGNEDYGPTYCKKYHQIYKVLKEHYPQLIYIADSPIGQDSEKQKYIEDFASEKEIEVYDEHYYHDIPWATNMFNKFDSYKREGIRLFVGELGISGPYPKNILAEGIFKMGMECNGDLSPIMADRPLMRNWDCIGRSNMQPLLLNTSDTSVRTFNYYLCKMLRDNPIDTSYTVENNESQDQVFVTAGRDNSRNEIVIKIVNLNDVEKIISLNFDMNIKSIIADVTTLSADRNEIVTPMTPDAVYPIKSTEMIRGLQSEIKVKANSLIIYRIKQ